MASEFNPGERQPIQLIGALVWRTEIRGAGGSFVTVTMDESQAMDEDMGAVIIASAGTVALTRKELRRLVSIVGTWPGMPWGGDNG